MNPSMLVTDRQRELIIPAIDGKRNFFMARQFFNGFLDEDFDRWGLNIASSPTPEMSVKMYNMVGHGSFEWIYGGAGRSLDELALTQAQVVWFIENLPRGFYENGCTTFFLLFKEKVKDTMTNEETIQFFVALVFAVSVNSFFTFILRFSSDFVWHARSRLRFVLPQLKVLAP